MPGPPPARRRQVRGGRRAQTFTRRAVGDPAGGEPQGISEVDHRSIRSEFQRTRPRARDDLSRSQAYAALGISPSAGDEEVKKAYRAMARKYHPDKVNHLGEEFVKMATEKFRSIHDAYTVIRKQRGF
jgi:DnaJ like chaperone protein